MENGPKRLRDSATTDPQMQAGGDSSNAGITRFDPYVSWLGLSARPQNHYQLLAVDAGSSTAEIEAAAYKQLAKLRKHQLGPHSEAAESLMNEVSIACDTLATDATRQKYDQHLREETPATHGGTTSATPQPPLPPVPPKAEIRQQLLICPVCSEWWMVSPELAGRQILCIGCQCSLQVSPDVFNLTPAPEPPPQPQPPAPPDVSHNDSQPAEGANLTPDEFTSQPGIVELEVYAGLILMIGGGVILVLALVLLNAVAIWLLQG